MATEYQEVRRQFIEQVERMNSADPGCQSACFQDAKKVFKRLQLTYSSLAYKPSNIKEQIQQFRKRLRDRPKPPPQPMLSSETDKQLLQVSLLRKQNRLLSQATKSLYQNESLAVEAGLSLAANNEVLDGIAKKSKDLQAQLNSSIGLIDTLKRHQQRNGLMVKGAVGLLALTLLAIMFWL